jgi:hypothetical protein
MTYFLIPLVVLLVLLLLFGLFVLLARFRGGRYLRPLLRVPLIGTGLKRMSQAALERSNPELASAMRKLERANAGRDPQRAQQALARLTPAERRAYMEAAGEQESMPEPVNRAQRRQLAKQRKNR